MAPTCYNMAVVVDDDHEMGITHVLREGRSCFGTRRARS